MMESLADKRNVLIRRRNASRKAATHCSNGVAVKAKNESLLLDTALVLAITNRASPLYSQNKTGKNSNRNSVRVLAW